MKRLTILKPGLFTSIQDGGRFGYRKYGVPVSGFMDHYSAALANALLNKPASAALLEITLAGPTIKFNTGTVIAITGADLSPVLDGQNLQMNSAHLVYKGQILSFGKNNYGSRTYLAIKHEISSEKILGSQSFCRGITKYYRLQIGSSIHLKEKSAKFFSPSSYVKPQLQHFNTNLIQVEKGPEFEYLTSSSKEQLNQIKYKISPENNRMGYRLSGPLLEIKESASMITSSILPGTVQLTPSGQLIILMRDCQTTGGYPRILQLTEKSINQLAQKKTGDEISLYISEKN